MRVKKVSVKRKTPKIMIIEFLNYLSAVKGYTDATVEGYRKDMRYFVEYAHTWIKDARWSRLTKKDIQDYVVWMHERNLENTTIRRRLASLRSLFDYAKTSGMVTENPARFVQAPKIAKKLPRTLAVNTLVDTIEDNTIDLKTRCQIALILETGIRLQEMLDLKIEDFNAKDRSIKINGKGQKERIVYYSDFSRNLLNQYASRRSGKLFNDAQREVRFRVFEALKRHNGNGQLSPHAIRHTFATAMLNNGASLSAIQSILGHSSVKTTERYAQIAKPTVKTEYELFKPV